MYPVCCSTVALEKPMLVFLLLPITCYSEIDESDLTFIPNGRYSLYLPGYCRPGFYRMLTDLQPPSRVWPLSNFRPHWISLGRSMPCGILRSSLSFETHESKKKIMAFGRAGTLFGSYLSSGCVEFESHIASLLGYLPFFGGQLSATGGGGCNGDNHDGRWRKNRS